MNKEQVLIETMFKYSDMGIEVNVLTEAAGVQTSALLEASGDAASLFSKLNDGRKELMKSIQNIDWKEWVKKMKETIKKIIRFITAPMRTAADLVTGKTTLKEVGQRLRQVWNNLRNKRVKTPEEKVAEKAVGEILQDVEKIEDKVNENIEETIDVTKELKSDTINPLFQPYYEKVESLSAKLDELTPICDQYQTRIENLFNPFIEDNIESSYAEYKTTAEFNNLDRRQKELYEEVIKYQTISIVGVDIRKASRKIQLFFMNLSTYEDIDLNIVTREYDEVHDMCGRLSYYPRYCSDIYTHLKHWSKK